MGEATRSALLKHFKSIKKIREASTDEVAAVIGPAKARAVKQVLNNDLAGTVE